MKKLALAAAFSVAATGAFAGSMEEPMVEAPVIVEEQSSSSNPGWVVPVLVLAVIAAAAAAN